MILIARPITSASASPRRAAITLLAVGAFLLGLSTPAQAAVTVPPDVATALQSFSANPQAAMTAWVGWARTQPMTFTNTAVSGKVSCAIDAASVTKCQDFDPNLDTTGYISRGTTYTLANNKTQVFKFHGAWVRNNFGANANPFTNTRRFYPYNYWLPWLTPGVPVATSVGTDGWYTVTAQNKNPGDDQSQVTVVRVAPDGLHAQFLQQSGKGKVDVRKTITLRDVPPIKVPASTPQHL
jgi:hypothetical protein